MAGRFGITNVLFTDCLRRPIGTTPRDLPLVVLLGTRGSGKTEVLTYLHEACKESEAIPYVFLDCETQPDRPMWRLCCAIADALHIEKWTGFGRLNFPRLTLGRLAVTYRQLPEDLTQAQEELRAELRAAVRLNQRADLMDDVITDVSQAVPAPPLVATLARWVVRLGAGSPRMVERLYRTGLTWYGTRFGRTQRSGLAVLVELNHRFHTDDQREVAERMLCEAFLDDINAAFARRREFNCAILLDNCDDPAGTDLLNLLADLRAERVGRRGADPLMVVATSRTVPRLTGLTSGWTFPWESNRPGTSRVPDPDHDQVSYRYWLNRGAPRQEPASWWLPVHLRDLARTELEPENARFIHRLTCGHPWSAHAVRDVLRSVSSDASPVSPSPAQLRTVLDHVVSQAEYLFAGLPTSLSRDLVLWSAARDVDTAASADIGEGDRLTAMTLHDELVKRLWLIPDSRLPGMTRRGPQLHPWLRRILLHELAKTPDRWSKVHLQLRDYAAIRHRPLDVAYHHLARGELSPVVDYLAGQFDQLDADSWIREFDAVTAAPSTRCASGTVCEQYDTLMLARGPLDREDRVRNTLWSMVAARWIWSDPLGDPAFELTNTIADGYVRLAEEAQTGLARYRSEAQVYRQMKAR
ncbi:MAG: hypothetical protein ACRDSL_13485 [Pseudonocardiaceae bacterium]